MTPESSGSSRMSDLLGRLPVCRVGLFTKAVICLEIESTAA
ncbi:hypothetical protein SSPIM334S_03939 [Streptomyces spiroverticillatus]